MVGPSAVKTYFYRRPLQAAANIRILACFLTKCVQDQQSIGGAKSRQSSLPGVIGSAVDDTGPDETRRLRIQRRSTNRAAQTGRVPRPTRHLDQEAIGDEFAARGADASCSQTHSSDAIGVAIRRRQDLAL